MNNKIKHPDFALRMDQACDENARVPAKNYGRLGWFVDEFETQFDVKVTAETIRKWFAGEVRPRHNMLMMLAHILKVDDAWFVVGAEDSTQNPSQKIHSQEANGLVNVIAGLIQLDGGTPAFPKTGDLIDLRAVIKAKLYSFHLALGREVDGIASFVISAAVVSGAASETVLIGALRVSQFAFDIYEIPWNELTAHGKRKSGRITLSVPRSDIDVSLKKIESFANGF